MIVAKVAGSAPTVKPPLDCVFIKQRFMAAIGCAEPGTAGGPACASRNTESSPNVDNPRRLL
jgi:hypothetical protein